MSGKGGAMVVASMKSISVIACVDTYFGIGLNNSIPWHLNKDMVRFKHITTNSIRGRLNVVAMGRRTWESIGCKPLPGRLNVVLSSTIDVNVGGVTVMRGFNEFLNLIDNKWCGIIDKVFIIGGASLYRYALESDRCDTVYLTMICKPYNCDTFFPVECLNRRFANMYESDYLIDGCTQYKISEFGRRRVVLPDTLPVVTHCEESQYLDIVRSIISSGNFSPRPDRTGVGTISCFGERMQFSLDNGVIPLLTTKRVFWTGIVEELLWFIRGDTNANHLRDAGVDIWSKHGSTEYLTSIGFPDRSEGDLGPVYGFQWRHFGAQYVDMDTNYDGQGVDQLSYIVDKLKSDPYCRRIVLTSWNPSDIPHMALPPCHMFCQFYVENKRLSCQLYQRSADMGLGVPFNIASYSLLTHMLAHVTGLKAHKLIHIIGDAHVYTDHIEALSTQLGRDPRPFPKLEINKNVQSLFDFSMSDFTVVGYNPHSAIKMNMAV